MLKSEAVRLLGGDVVLAAKAIGVTRQAVEKWPEDHVGPLPVRIEDRVLAALWRRQQAAGQSTVPAAEGA
jgi:hypothetical protein